tara:strand:- start:3949 stop:5322 length:1374 start_codon:yes stop_codon:yes gene_type:complete
MSETISFSKYGKSFQETLARLILEDRPFSDQIDEVLDYNFFELKYLRVFVKKIYEYKQTYNVHPTKNIVATIVRTELEDENEAIQKQVRDFFARALIGPANDVEYVKATSLDFCKKQKLKEAILKSVDLLQRSSYDEIHSLIDEALRLGTDNNFGHDYIKDFEARYELKLRNPSSTGWTEIDKICKGGLGMGELGVVIAPTGAGKSMALVHLGAEALKQGKSVVHYTLELSEEVVGQRYDSCLSGCQLTELHKKKNEVYESIKDLEASLIIKEYPTRSASVNTIKNHLDKLIKKGVEIQMVIVDYGDLLKSTSKFKEKRNELESIYEELRAVSQTVGCPVWTASQTNRSGLNAEVVTMESISEAFSKCFVADFIFSLSRTVEDKSTNSGRIFVAKNRNGPDGIIYPIFMDTSCVDIKVFKQAQESIQQIKDNSARDEAKRLKEKYKQFRKAAGTGVK